MRITPLKVYFIVSDEDGGPKQPLVWCELPVSYYFREYTLSGVSDQYNEIYLEFASSVFQIRNNRTSLELSFVYSNVGKFVSDCKTGSKITKN